MAAQVDSTAVIREATKEDMPQVHGLIGELAEFEKLETQMKIDPNVLVKEGFEDAHPAFRCFVAEVPGIPSIVGYALFYYSYSTWLGRSVFLEDIYVQPEHQGKSIGKKLFLAVAKVAHELPSKRLDFHVLGWNPAIGFYEGLGATDISSTETWKLFRLNDEALDRIFA